QIGGGQSRLVREPMRKLSPPARLDGVDRKTERQQRDAERQRNRQKGIVTLATFTCQPREAVIGRRQENQWLGELQRGTGPLQNPLFLANVTMPVECVVGGGVG